MATKQEFFWEYMRRANETKEVLDNIPTASLQTITATEVGTIQNPRNMKAVIVNGGIVASVSKNYQLVQHKDAFKPVFDGLHQTGTPYEFALFQTDTKAFLNVFVDEIGDNGSGIKLGFRVINSIDGRNAISYAIKSETIERSTTIELVGYRLACQNGLKIRVPLSEATELRLEKKVVEKVEELIKMATRIVHMGTEQEIKAKMEAISYVTEAVSLLKEPIAIIMKKAKNKQIGEEEAKRIIALYLGKRMNKQIIERFKEEEQSIWGIFQAVTNIASHGCSIPTMNGLINNSATMLEQEIFPKKV
jgi:hypothetical protein